MYRYSSVRHLWDGSPYLQQLLQQSSPLHSLFKRGRKTPPSGSLEGNHVELETGPQSVSLSFADLVANFLPLWAGIARL